MSANNARWLAWRQQGISTQGINAYVMMGIVALFLTLTANVTFFDKATEIYPFAQHIGFIGSLPLVLYGVMLLVIVLLSYRYTLKAVLIFLLLTAAVTAYFTDTYGMVKVWAKTAFIYMACLIKSRLKRKNTSHRCFGQVNTQAFKQCHLILNSPMMLLPQPC